LFHGPLTNLGQADLCVCLCVRVWWSEGSRSVSNDVDDDGDHDVESVKKVTKKPSAEKPAPVKLVPAPPPKENIWEKRKSENQAASRQQQSSTSVESAPDNMSDKVNQSQTPSESLTTSSHGEESTSPDRVSLICLSVALTHVTV